MTRNAPLALGAALLGLGLAAGPRAALAAPPTPPQATLAAAGTHAPTRAFITLEVPAKSLVVGQAVPVKIRAYFRAGVSATLTGAPHLTSDAFTLSDLSDKPAQIQVERHGEPYLQATWTAVLAPAKPVEGPLTVELPVELAYREAARAAPRSIQDVFGSDPFAGMFDDDDFFGGGDPFSHMQAQMDSMFDIGPLQRVETTLRSSTKPIAVTDPPAEGRPAAYTGAVGHFGIAVAPPEPGSAELHVGEPLQIQIRVTGTGNFDRVAVPGLPASESLKTYGLTSAFVPQAGSTFTGTKTFTQTIVPTSEGTLALPAVALAYFDPTTHAYATVTSAPVSLAIGAARGGGAADPGLAATVRDPAMRPDRLAPGPAHATLAPLYRQARTRLALVALALATALVVLLAGLRRSRRVARALTARRVHRRIARATSAMTRAARSEDRTGFFLAARAALQQRLAADWHTSPAAVTAHDVEARLGARGERIREVFEQADGVDYGGPAAVTEPLSHWHTIVRGELANLEVSP